ncbi:FG-GAP-like repeat-containing protein, partial [bacterium]|nr:FG-GAP-like repeat-containing protein [bacterium]
SSRIGVIERKRVSVYIRLSWLWLFSLILIAEPHTLPAQIEFKRHTIDNNLVSAAWVQAIDMDGDGDLDLVTGSYRGVDWWQNAANNFTKNFIGSFRGTWAVHADDVDADGDIDVIGASSSEDEFSFWQRKSVTQFSETSLGEALGPESVHAADLDGDGDLDIVGAAWADGQILWWRNDGNGRFDRKIVDGAMNNAHSVSTGDLDNDGDSDILATGVGGTRWYRNDGNQKFKKHTIHKKGGWSVFIDDIDGDGDQDFLRPQRNNGDVVLFWNDGTGRFDQQIIEPGFGDCWAIATGDIDGDGKVDIAGAGFAAGEIRVWLNDGNHRFSDGQVVESVDKPRGIYVADIDGDGDGDLAAAIRGDRDLAWYEVVGTPKSITVNAPSDQDEIFSGSNIVIDWSFSGSIDSVRIELSVDGGQVWTTLTEASANDRQYEWQVPHVASDSSVIRISEAMNPSVFGTSSGLFSIVPSSLLLDAPNGGENWSVSEDQQITWTTVGGVDSVRLEYSLDNGATWLLIVDWLPNDGVYVWSLPDVTSDNCKVRIVDIQDGQLDDQSDDVFAIRGSTVVLQSPNGNEKWFAGTTQSVLWTSEGRIDSVGLEYTVDAGMTWLSIIDQTESDGEFLWEVPAITSDSCKVRVVGSGPKSAVDESDGLFAIKPTALTLVSPNGEESWVAGTEIAITWQSAGLVDSVKLEYSLDAGTSWQEIANPTANDGHHEWEIPELTSDQCLVRVSKAGEDSTSDMSDAVFSIRASILALRLPNGGEFWQAGSLQEIAWDFSGQIDSVRLEYSIDDGREWFVITDNVENTGSYSWPVPAVTSDSCLVRISDAVDGQPTIQSHAVFSIAVVVSVTSGETFPEAYRLHQNYPNPFNLGTRISYELPMASAVRLVIYDLLGREVRRLVDSFQRSGFHEVIWDGIDNNDQVVSSGVYILQLRAGAFSKSLKVLLAK